MYLLSFITEMPVVCNKLDFYVFIPITESMFLVVDY